MAYDNQKLKISEAQWNNVKFSYGSSFLPSSLIERLSNCYALIDDMIFR